MTLRTRLICFIDVVRPGSSATRGRLGPQTKSPAVRQGILSWHDATPNPETHRRELRSSHQRYTVRLSMKTVAEPPEPYPSIWKLVSRVGAHPSAKAEFTVALIGISRPSSWTGL